MSDDSVLNMYETQVELEKIKEEEIQKQNHELKSSIETANEVQSKVDVLPTNSREMQETVTALSNRVSNHDEQLNKNDAILSQQNEFSTEQNETTQVLKTNENNLEEQTVLLVGGTDAKHCDSLVILENNGQSWKKLNIKLPYEIFENGAQFLNNNLYIFGGCNSTCTPLNWTYKLSKSLKWEKMADMNTRLRGISNSNVILNNQIWVMGGTDEGMNEWPLVEMYDPSTNKWNYMKAMNYYRSGAAAAVVNGKIFCCGGTDGWDVFNSIEYYDPSSDVWTVISDMPQGIMGHGVVEINGNLIVMGGYADKCLNSVWALDTTDKNAKWIEKPSMSIPRGYFGIAKIHDKIFICGGATKENNEWKHFDSVEIFDGEVWRDGPKMPTTRETAPAVVIPMSFARYLN